MSRITRWMDAKLYPNHTKNWDDVLFRERILSHLLQGATKDVLDLGAGAGIVSQMNFKGTAHRICRDAMDTFPTCYLVNTPRDVRSLVC